MRNLTGILLVACSGGGKDPDTTPDAADTDTDADTDSDTDADSDSDSDADTDTDTPTGDTGASWLLPACPANPPNDTILFFDPTTQITLAGDELVASFGYSCGCSNHVVGSCFGASFGASTPPELDLHVLHEANGEMCEAFCYDEVRVDLLPVQQQYLETYGAASGAVDLEVRWLDGSGAQLQVVPYAW